MDAMVYGMDLDALTDEVLNRANILGRISDDPDRLTRLFLGPSARKVQELLTTWMVQAKLFTEVDAVGNLHGIGRLHRDDPNSHIDPKDGVCRRFIVGSHVDTVPDAGRYDGILGVLLGIAAAQALCGQSFAKRLHIIAFSEEEGVRFQFPYIGSLAVCGRLTPDLLARTDSQGVTVAEVIRNYGLDTTKLSCAAYQPEMVAGYLEAHIEQGPVLEARNLSLGAVTAILGQSRAWVRLIGHAGHAGTQPMDLRKDALVAAAEVVVAVEALARSTTGLRATVGNLIVAPGATNVIPGNVKLSLDMRHANDSIRANAVEKVLATINAIVNRRGLVMIFEPTMDQPATICNPQLTEKLLRAMEDEGYPAVQIESGAGHDAVIMTSLCPVTMLFLRSPGGISHHPAESVRRNDVRAALAVMVRFLQNELSDP